MAGPSVSENAPAAGQGEQMFRLPVLVPTAPIFPWLTARDALGWPALAVLDLAATPLQAPGLRALAQAMAERGVRIVGLAGIDPAVLGDQAGQLPPVLAPAGAAMPASPPPPGPPESPQADRTLADNLPVRADSLVVEGNLRSGQSVRHLAGDVSIVGSVASGAEVVAGGSVHVYGTLRGRAVAGAGGGAGQIFCLRLEAEVLVINDAALVADDMAPALLGRAVRAVREGEAIRLHPMG